MENWLEWELDYTTAYVTPVVENWLEWELDYTTAYVTPVVENWLEWELDYTTAYVTPVVENWLEWELDYTTAFVTPVVEKWLEWETDYTTDHTRTLPLSHILLRSVNKSNSRNWLTLCDEFGVPPTTLIRIIPWLIPNLLTIPMPSLYVRQVCRYNIEHITSEISNVEDQLVSNSLESLP